MDTPGRIKNALIFSDLHLGWNICDRHHHLLLDRIGEAAEDCELIVMNGDIIDRYRTPRGWHTLELVKRLEQQISLWQREGRTVAYVEGNHDPMAGDGPGLRPDRWHFDFEGKDGQHIRVLHGHKAPASDIPHGLYERYGRHFLAMENSLYRSRVTQILYQLGLRWWVTGIALLEDRLGRPQFLQRWGAAPDSIDTLVHGHFHFGPGSGNVGKTKMYKSGAWVSPGNPGSVDRILRYRRGNFERLEYCVRQWRAAIDGR